MLGLEARNAPNPINATPPVIPIMPAITSRTPSIVTPSGRLIAVAVDPEAVGFLNYISIGGDNLSSF
jgi:hypothetical protein